MAKKNLELIIVAEQGYLRPLENQKKFCPQNDILFTAISNTYIPLLNMFRKFEDENISFKIGLVLSSALCTLLEDTDVQNEYVQYLDQKIALGYKEKERLLSDSKKLSLAQRYLEKYIQDKYDFTEIYKCRLVPEFRRLAENKKLELIPTAATYAFLPHYHDMTEILNAQVEVGLSAHRHFFGEAGSGFYLPYLGWTDAVDRVLKSYGVNYTVVDTPALLFSENANDEGIFTPVRSKNSLVLFGRDSQSDEYLKGDDSYKTNEVYRNEMRDIGFDLDYKELSPFIEENDFRCQTGYKYFAGEDEDTYDFDKASLQAKEDARDFYAKTTSKLFQAAELLGERDANLVYTIPAELLGQTWFEGSVFFEELVRTIAGKNEVTMAFCSEQIKNSYSLQKISPYPCSDNGAGYGELLLDSKNCWTMRYIRKACERMIDLTERFPSDTGLKARLLNLAAREVLLCQSGDIAMMLHDQQFPDYAEAYFKNCIQSFSTVFESLGSNSVSTEWLTKVEKNHAIFPWINYRVFSRKK